MPVQGAASRPVRLRELSLKQEPAGHAPAWRKHWAVPDRDSYERLEVPAISHISQRGPAALTSRHVPIDVGASVGPVLPSDPLAGGHGTDRGAGGPGRPVPGARRSGDRCGLYRTAVHRLVERLP